MSGGRKGKPIKEKEHTTTRVHEQNDNEDMDMEPSENIFGSEQQGEVKENIGIRVD